MKKRITGRVNGDRYEILNPEGGVTRSQPMSEARADSKLAAAIKRNGWEDIPDAG